MKTFAYRQRQAQYEKRKRTSRLFVLVSFSLRAEANRRNALVERTVWQRLHLLGRHAGQLGFAQFVLTVREEEAEGDENDDEEARRESESRRGLVVGRLRSVERPHRGQPDDIRRHESAADKGASTRVLQIYFRLRKRAC